MIVSVTYSAFSDGKTLSLVDRSLNPVSMLHYNTDLSLRTMGLRRQRYPHTDAHDGQSYVGLHNDKSNVLPWKARDGADSYFKRIDSWMFFWTARSLGSHLGNQCAQDWIHTRIKMIQSSFSKPLWINSQT